jgi:hypothetical protein
MNYFTAALVLCICGLVGAVHAQDALDNKQSTLYVNVHKIGYFDESSEMKWADVEDEFELTPIEDGIQFSFHITAPNYHFCGMKGTAIKKSTHYEYREMVRGSECVLKIFVTDGTVRLEDEGLVCRTVHCGARGGIDGIRFTRTE